VKPGGRWARRLYDGKTRFSNSVGSDQLREGNLRTKAPKKS